MIYIDNLGEGHAQLETIYEWGRTLLVEIEDDLYQDYLKGKYKILDNQLVDNPDYEDEQQQAEKERIAMLKMTPRDFLLALVELGVDYNEIKQLKSTNAQVEIELDYCNFIYRGNPLLDQLAPQFNISKEQLDNLFKEKGV